ncbi:hypothetical protein [Streptomyces sp. TM32]|uniref:hypothetical protein n=1 Tax=Streptomyces sp. TM32 TaxID=1652669 RepID=UPI0020B12AD1|nr:hypothetical protein [Streptomyces sp. TM32]
MVVYGPAASSALDRDQQVLAADFLDRAMPEWFRSGANVREQHDAKRAVGVGVGLTKGDDGAHYVTARIVDPVAVAKVKHGVLKGFSVGIKNPKIAMGKTEAPNGIVTDGTVCELSVCDRPANSECIFSLAKADGADELQPVEDPHLVEKSSAEAFGLPRELYDRLAAPVKDALAKLAAGGATVSAETVKSDDDAAPQLVVNVAVTATEVAKADTSAAGRREAAAEGAALPDGSYPIKTKADLRKAIRAVGRGGADHDKIRKHVMKRAKALGLEAMVPKNWNADGSLKTATKSDDDEVTAKAEQVLRDVRALAPALAKADDSADDDAVTSAGDGGEHDEAADISGADEAIACIARLIIAEAESLAQGNLNEACDIDLLLSAVRSLAWFKQNEEYEEASAASKSDAVDPATEDSTETSAPSGGAAQTTEGDKPEEDTTEEGEPTDGEQPTDAVTKADVAELVKAAVAQAAEASEERTKALEAELAKANAAIEEFRAMPTAGGPALTRTAAQQAQAKGSDADRMRAEAKTLMAKADQVADRDLRDGYRDRAKALLAKADA